MLRQPLLKSLFQLIIFSLPLMIGQLAQMLIGVGDMVVAAWHSTEALAAIGLALAVIHPLFIGAIGFLAALSPVLANIRGEGENPKRYAFGSFVYGLVLSLPFSVLIYFSALFVDFFNYDAVLSEHIKSYIRISAFSISGAMIFLALKEYLQSYERVLFANILSVACVFLNIALNHSLVFGSIYTPALGIDGLAWASVCVRWFMGLAMIAYVLKDLLCGFNLRFDFMQRVSKLGLPLAITFFFEVLAFSCLTLLVGHFGQVQAAASSLVLNLASTSFMIPLALSGAMAVKIGHAYGGRDYRALFLHAKAGLMAIFLYVVFTTTVFLFFPQYLLRLYSPEAEVMEIGLRMIFWVALFQIFDCSQIALGGILRGIAISKVIAIVTFFAYWVIGVPLGY